MADLLDQVLADARTFGFLGPGPVADQRAHAEAFLSAIELGFGRRAVDLGSGGGVPGLVLATLLPDTTWVLLDVMQRRTAFLAEAVTRLGLGDRVKVQTARAEDAGRDPSLRGQAELVVSRGFGPPAVTAECAAPLLGVGGQLVVSEPPGSQGDRWPEEPLQGLGLVPEGVIEGPPSFMRLRQRDLAPVSAPRRSGLPAKRPLW